MFGVVLFALILLFYGVILSGEIVVKAFPQTKSFYKSVEETMDKGATRLFLSLGAIVVGIWNFFAPDFTALYSPPVIGALIPSLLIIVSGTVIYPNVIEILNIPQELKDKYYSYIEKYKGFSGIATFFAGLLHLILFRQILF